MNKKKEVESVISKIDIEINNLDQKIDNIENPNNCKNNKCTNPININLINPHSNQIYNLSTFMYMLFI